jgi:hypothetical protein
VAPKGLSEPGFIKVHDLRMHSEDAKKFDQNLKNQILISQEDIALKESN